MTRLNLDALAKEALMRRRYREELHAFFEGAARGFHGSQATADAVRTAGSLGMFPDGPAPVSEAQAMLCWKIVEAVRRHGFPPR